MNIMHDNAFSNSCDGKKFNNDVTVTRHKHTQKPDNR